MTFNALSKKIIAIAKLPVSFNIIKEKFEEVLKCPLTLEVFQNPVTTNLGHTFSKESYEELRTHTHNCPITRCEISSYEENKHVERLVKALSDEKKFNKFLLSKSYIRDWLSDNHVRVKDFTYKDVKECLNQTEFKNYFDQLSKIAQDSFYKMLSCYQNNQEFNNEELVSWLEIKCNHLLTKHPTLKRNIRQIEKLKRFIYAIKNKTQFDEYLSRGDFREDWTCDMSKNHEGTLASKYIKEWFKSEQFKKYYEYLKNYKSLLFTLRSCIDPFQHKTVDKAKDLYKTFKFISSEHCNQLNSIFAKTDYKVRTKIQFGNKKYVVETVAMQRHNKLPILRSFLIKDGYCYSKKEFVGSQLKKEQQFKTQLTEVDQNDIKNVTYYTNTNSGEGILCPILPRLSLNGEWSIRYINKVDCKKTTDCMRFDGWILSFNYNGKMNYRYIRKNRDYINAKLLGKKFLEELQELETHEKFNVDYHRISEYETRMSLQILNTKGRKYFQLITNSPYL